MLRSDVQISLPFKINETGVTPDNDGIDLEGSIAADAGKFVIPFPCEVDYAAIVVTEGIAPGTPEIKFDKRPTAGSDTARGDGDIGDINLGVAGVSDVGDVAYDLVARGTTLEPGQEVVVQIVTAVAGGGTGTVWPQLVVRATPETFANLSNMQETA